MHRYLARTPKHVIQSMFNLVCSHDTIRIKKRLNDDPRRMKLAYLLMFIQAGSPNIYYGDEIGMTGFHDPDNRRPMIWDEKKQDLDMLQFIKQLIHLKQNNPLLNVADIKFDHYEDVLVMQKHLNQQTLILIINNSEKSIQQYPSTDGYECLMQSDDVLSPYSYFLGVRK